jgi:hypothetical protein
MREAVDRTRVETMQQGQAVQTALPTSTAPTITPTTDQGQHQLLLGISEKLKNLEQANDIPVSSTPPPQKPQGNTYANIETMLGGKPNGTSTTSNQMMDELVRAVAERMGVSGGAPAGSTEEVVLPNGHHSGIPGRPIRRPRPARTGNFPPPTARSGNRYYYSSAGFTSKAGVFRGVYGVEQAMRPGRSWANRTYDECQGYGKLEDAVAHWYVEHPLSSLCPIYR